MTGLPVPFEAVEEATARVGSVLDPTPLLPAPGLSARAGRPVLLKLETVQPTGSFKVRGAASKILSLPPERRQRGVVTASTGNHGRAVAYIAGTLGVPATVCLSERVPPGKVDALRQLGCRLEIEGRSQSDALAAAAALVDTEGMTMVHPFDDAEVIAGQGTIGVEIARHLDGGGSVLIPLSGGGLLSGIGLALRQLSPGTRIVGLSMEQGAAMAASLAAGHPVEMEEAPTLADSLQGGIGLDNAYTFRMVEAVCDEVGLLSEEEIAAGMREALTQHRLVVEGAGAVGIGAILSGRFRFPPGPVVVICSGANAELEHIATLARGDLPG